MVVETSFVIYPLCATKAGGQKACRRQLLLTRWIGRKKQKACLATGRRFAKIIFANQSRVCKIPAIPLVAEDNRLFRETKVKSKVLKQYHVCNLR